jgi:hypothetical protein
VILFVSENVVKVENDWVTLTAVHTRVVQKVSVDFRVVLPNSSVICLLDGRNHHCLVCLVVRLRVILTAVPTPTLIPVFSGSVDVELCQMLEGFAG